MQQQLIANYFSVNGRIHIYHLPPGGYDGLNILNSVERYDPHTGHWTSVTPMATKRSGRWEDRKVHHHRSLCVCGCLSWDLCSVCRGWGGVTQRPHLRGGRLRWRLAPRLRWGLQHQNGLLDHCGQYDHPSVLRGSHCTERTSLCHCWVRESI